MPIAYSYKRFSSDAQEGNDSIRRQTAAANRFINEHPEFELVLDTTLSLTDAGVSAYKGKNLSKAGALGMFMEAVREGLIERGSWLLLESLDRFTRLPVNIAANELLSLINRGIIVVTLHNQTIYREEDFEGDDGLVKLMGAMIAMQGHHSEQVSKGKRVSAAWKNSYNKAAAGGHIITKIIPFWLEVKPDRTGFNVNEDRASIVREIYQRRADGEGKSKIANDLTRRGVPTSKGKGSIWHPSAVAKLLDSDNPAGTFINRHGERFEGYYPEIVDPDVFQVVRSLRRQSPSTGKSIKAHVLTGLVKHDCGTTMRRINKGVKSSGIRLQCPKCLNAIPFSEALSLVSEALFSSQWVAANTFNGEATLQKEHDLDGLSLEIEDAYLDWRKAKTLETRRLYERLLEEHARAQRDLQETKGTNTEVLASMEEQALARASAGGSILTALGSVVTSASFDNECTQLTVSTISGKIILVHRSNNLSY
jgi:DNA invertase Pin-like site-specific DNA recombinase